MVEASEFSRQALYEVHRRGTEKATKVCAVTDGAEWEQGFIDYHRADAVRILDFAHVAEKIASVGRIIYGDGTPQFEQWFEDQRHALKGGREGQVLDELRKLKRRAQRKQLVSQLQTVEDNLKYLEKRRSMIEYGKFQRKGYPIGSGTVESANKVVVQSRLKQAGMHWARTNVNPMLALRNVACNERWNEACGEVTEHRQELMAARFRQRSQRKLPTETAVEEFASNNISIAKSVTAATSEESPLTTLRIEKRPYRPGPDHPWRKMRYGRASRRLSGPKI